MENNAEKKWLDIQECVAFGRGLGLYRTAKTYRKWAQAAHERGDDAGDIIVRKQDTENNFRYQVEQNSLEIKVRQELEFERQNRVRTGAHTSAPSAGGDSTEEKPIEEEEADPEPTADDELERLRDENTRQKATIEELTLDNRVKSQLVLQAREERKDMLNRLEKTNHKIGSLETQLLALGAPKENDHNPQNEETSPHEGSRDGGLQ